MVIKKLQVSQSFNRKWVVLVSLSHFSLKKQDAMYWAPIYDNKGIRPVDGFVRFGILQLVYLLGGKAT